jgi:hypothetical protein
MQARHLFTWIIRVSRQGVFAFGAQRQSEVNPTVGETIEIRDERDGSRRRVVIRSSHFEPPSVPGTFLGTHIIEAEEI